MKLFNIHTAAIRSSLLLALLAALGCSTGTRAVPIAAARAGCPGDKVKVIKQDGHDLTLEVCGVYEDWRWNALNGWEYEQPSSEQPLSTPMDADADGVPDDSDACLGVAGVASLDLKTNGCPPAADGDGDGVADAADACPTVVGIAQPDPKLNGCPPDADGDSIADAADGCPDKAGPANADAKLNGCPPDKDGDGVSDGDDACPDKAGSANADAKLNGCPPDKDGDGISDSDDACPDAAGVTSGDTAKNGCPAEGAATKPDTPASPAPKPAD